MVPTAVLVIQTFWNVRPILLLRIFSLPWFCGGGIFSNCLALKGKTIRSSDLGNCMLITKNSGDFYSF